MPFPPTIAGPPARSRGRTYVASLIALVIVASLATGLAASVAAANPKLPTCKVADTLTKQRSLGQWQRSVLDSGLRLGSGYIPTDLKSTSAAGLNSGERVRSFVIPDLTAMAKAARAAGARLLVQSAYRSYTTQKSTFAYWVRVHGMAYALKESARAGHSEHQLGTSIDFRAYGGSVPWAWTDWGKSKAGNWLAANAWKYGFILSYPKGKTTLTCYMYEPWHYRYVGREVAAKVHDSKLTLREYLWRAQEWPAPTPTPTADTDADPHAHADPDAGPDAAGRGLAPGGQSPTASASRSASWSHSTRKASWPLVERISR